MLKFAIIGAGYIGKRHADVISQMPEAQLMAICDPRAEDLTDFLLDVPYFHEAEAMLADCQDVDVVAICSPNGWHARHAIMALEAGKHVVIEKPMALTKTECEQIIHASFNAHKQVFCVMQNRYSPPAVWMKDVLQQGVLGSIRMVIIECYWNRDDRYYSASDWKGKRDMDGGVLFTQFSHFIDVMYRMFGDIKNISAKMENFAHRHNTEFEDSGTVMFDFVNGGMGLLSFSTAVADHNFESSLTVIAENGTVRIGGQYMNEVLHCDIRGYEMPVLEASAPPNDYGTHKGSASNHKAVIRNVIETLEGKTQVTTNALEGLKVVEIIERIYQAAGNR
jgi:UDP-N-acetyl-2-amino-2-deoxyglucuronate dehydrogenase